MAQTIGKGHECLAVLTVWAAALGCGLADGSAEPSSERQATGSGGSMASSTDPTPVANDTCAAAGLRIMDTFTLPASSIRKGDLVESAGSGPRIQLPAGWLDWYDSFGNNLHLSRSELDAIEHGSGDWDADYSYVLNSLLPFDQCAMHVGGEGWGGYSVSFADLQLRAYVVDESPTELIERAKATTWEAITPEISTDQRGGWTQLLLSYDRWYADYGGRANVDLRLHRLEDSTVIMAGMYTDVWAAPDEFDAVLGTVCVRAGDDAECCRL